MAFIGVFQPGSSKDIDVIAILCIFKICYPFTILTVLHEKPTSYIF